MSATAPELGYLYHVYDGKIVMDRTSHIDQVHAHYAGDPKFTGKWIAWGFTPMSDKEQAVYAKHHNLAFDNSSRPPLKPYTPPPAVRRPGRRVRKGQK